MPKADKITGIFKAFGEAPSPIAYVSAIGPKGESGRRIALLDTGADCTFMSMKAAKIMLDMTQPEIEGGAYDETTTAEGKKTRIYILKRDLRLWNAVAGGNFIPMKDAKICVMSELLREFSVLIGQRDGFQNRVFRHSNRNKPVWELWSP